MKFVRKKYIKCIVFIILFVIALALFNYVKADEGDTITYNIGSEEELITVNNELRNKIEKKIIYNITDDFTSAKTTLSVSWGNNVTVIGNNHTVYFDFGGQSPISVGNESTLNLGTPNNNTQLTIKGKPAGADGPGLCAVQTKSTLNMYSGVTLKDYVGSNYYGGGVTINSQSKFHMYGGTIENCGLKNSSNCYGGAIGAIKGSEIIIEDGAVIKDCFVTTDYYHPNNKWQSSNCAGGAIFVSTGSSLIMNGGVIEGCKASGMDGTFNPGAVGGAIAAPTSVNAYYAHGGYGYLDSCVEINGGTIKNCYADAVGGAIFAGGAYVQSAIIGAGKSYSNPSNPNEYGVRIKNADISNNKASSGGGIFLNRIKEPVLTIKNTKIQSNTAEDGAGIEIYGDGVETVIAGCTITDNISTNGSGGGILIDANTNSKGTTISDSEICNNIASESGSDVYIGGNSIVKLMAAETKKPVYKGNPEDAKNRKVDGWYIDEEDLRYVNQKPTERVLKNDYSNMTTEANDSISLIAAVNPVYVEVTFDTNGIGESPKKQLIVKFDKVEKPEGDMWKEGNVYTNNDGQKYQFDGWYKGKDTTKKFDFSVGIEENSTIYAKWIKIAEEVINEEENNDDGSVTKEDEEIKPQGDKVQESDKRSISTGDKISLYVGLFIVSTIAMRYILKKKKIKSRHSR